jgi:hypothetical protein
VVAALTAVYAVSASSAFTTASAEASVALSVAFADFVPVPADALAAESTVGTIALIIDNPPAPAINCRRFSFSTIA